MKNLSERIVRYIISFMLQDNEAAKEIGYGKIVSSNTKILIRQSDFFDDSVYMTTKSMPALPLKEWRGIPILFGETEEEQIDNTLVLQADLVASAFFLMTRYEEFINYDNYDNHHRFTGSGSLPGKAGFLERPILDEYGIQLRNLLRERGVKLKPLQPGTIYLTHDVDHPWRNWTLYSALCNCVAYTKQLHKIVLWPLKNYLGFYQENPLDTFDWIFTQDNRAKRVLKNRCKDIYFLLAAKADKYTKSYIFDKKINGLIERLNSQGACIGLHIGYKAGHNSDKMCMEQEKQNLEKYVGREVRLNRNHYLMSVKPADFRTLIQIGITEDFTMGYADRVGFRLGTSRATCWIDPEFMQITNLLLHPLLIMEGSMVESQYMGLGKEESWNCITRIYEVCAKVKGDFSVLFHNNIFAEGKYSFCKDIYQDMIKMICDKES